MKEDGEIEEGLPSGEEEAEQEPQPLYDPLTEPWNDPASTSVVEHRLSEGHREFAPRPGAAPRYWERPFPDVEELSELRRRLREETVVVPKRELVGATYAGFWIRLAAYIVDATVVGILTLPILIAIDAQGALSSIATIAIAVIYTVGFWSAMGATPGKMAVGVKIVGRDGEPLHAGQAFLRYVGYIVSTLTLGIGFLMIAFTGQKRGIHDYVAGTVVVKRDTLALSRPALPEAGIAVPRPQMRWAVTLRELTETLLLAGLIFLAVHVSMQNFKVEGASMEPSLDNGEYLIVSRLAYAEIDLSIFDWVPFFDAGDNPVHHLWSSPARGDVIVFRSPTSPGFERDFIKRIIGVPGDVVEIDRETGVVRVNEQMINEPYIRGKTNCSSSCGPWVVPERSYFVMGDNRNNSSDSRQGWFAPEGNIIGKALITYWYDGSPELDLAPNHEVSFISEAAAEE